MLKIKRVYDPHKKADGYRVLVDRLWPRGLSKADAHLDEWLKDVAPSPDLRLWFGHELDRWDEFVRLYRLELKTPASVEHLDRLRKLAATRTVTLLFAARDENHNNAVVVRDALSACD